MESLLESINMHKKVFNILKEYSNHEGICRITQKEVAQKIDRSQAIASRIIRRMIKYGSVITRMRPGVYKINKDFSEELGPFKTAVKLMFLVQIIPDIYFLSYKEQCKILKVNLKELQMSYGYIKRDIQD